MRSEECIQCYDTHKAYSVSYRDCGLISRVKFSQAPCGPVEMSTSVHFYKETLGQTDTQQSVIVGVICKTYYVYQLLIEIFLSFNDV